MCNRTKKIKLKRFYKEMERMCSASKKKAFRWKTGKVLQSKKSNQNTEDVWRLTKWKDFYFMKEVRRGLRLRLDAEINSEVKRACKDFCQWLRLRYIFPIRIPLYIKKCPKRQNESIVRRDFFFESCDRYDEPYICVFTQKDERELTDMEKDNLLADILGKIAYFLTYYFQWINNITLSETNSTQQARLYAADILREYAQTRKHP